MRRKELNTEEMDMQKPSDIVIPSEGVIVREPESIAAMTSPLEKKYADALQFGEDNIELMIQPSSEENAPTVIDVYVNGEAKYIPVGQRVTLKRKFVEVLLRAKPISVNTIHDSHTSGKAWIDNKLIRNARAKYPMSILHDPSPKGEEWLRNVMYEAA